MRPGQQLEAAQRQHADLCKLISAKVVTLHTILLGVSGTCCREHTMKESNTSHNQGLEPGTSNNPPDSH
eukprot:248777-Pelagomonas_calceolata.AAC.1